MATDAAQYQWNKFCNALDEREIVIPCDDWFENFRSGLIDSIVQMIVVSPEELRDLLCRINDVLSECRIFAHHYNQRNYKNIFRFNPLTSKLYLWNTRQKLEKIEADCRQFCELKRQNPRRLSLSLPVFEDEEEDEDETTTIRLFDEMAVEVEGVLLGRKGQDQSHFNAYGITGMPGTGKTVLARHVFNSTTIRQEFPIRIWACLSDLGEDDVEIRLVKFLLEQLNYDAGEELRGSDTEDIIQLLTELKNRLHNHKYLIVFDDVRKESKWYENLLSPEEESSGHSCNRLSYGLPKGTNSGGAVIVTSRLEDLVKRMVGENSFTTCLDQENETVQQYRLGETSQDRIKMASKIENVIFGRGGKDFVAYGITGMAGSGKTALARQIFNSECVRQEFSIRIWVSLFDRDIWDTEEDHNMDVGIKIVKYMLEQLDYDAVHADEEIRGSDANDIIQLLTELKKRLSKHKYLIVFDGVWQENKWWILQSQNEEEKNCLSYGLPKATRDNGGAVIVTGRVEDRVKRMIGEKSLITRIEQEDQELQDICWKIFEDTVEKDGVIDMDHPTFEKIKDDIIYKIQGLPLAAKTLAHIISYQIDETDRFDPFPINFELI